MGGISEELGRGTTGCSGLWIKDLDSSWMYTMTHLQGTLLHAELLLRRGDSSLYNNITGTGAGSIRRAVLFLLHNPNDSSKSVPWKVSNDGTTLELVHRYYRDPYMAQQLGIGSNRAMCGKGGQMLHFGTITHGFSVGELPGPLPTPTDPPPPPPTGGQLISFYPEADAYVRGGTYASQNFGTDISLAEKNSDLDSFDRRTFLRFDLSSISSTSITRATLKLYVTSLIEGTAPIPLFGVPSNSWTETGVTWNNQPAFGSQLASTSLPTIGWASFDVTSFVNSQLGGDKKVSLMLWNTAQAIKLVTINSRENALNQPVLEVTK
ncbi:MAG: hypothetical protein DMG06_05285 [Acidobacteria bacterium]|nr:MAG: hypothetical protein DMG06_05285 [Acidobacteriota bacterium]